ncbi:MAG TPA: hypothetical protein VJH03_09085 [Blastocatellia bacterium]|nr:hypothetical protein [Blastocatellia bacterium]
MLAILTILALIAGAAYFVLRRPARVPMERFAPATSLAFIEVDSLPDLVDGITSTKAWREVAPVLGLSSQIRQIGLAADLMSRAGIGTDETVVAGRAQLAVVLTKIESKPHAAEGLPSVPFKIAIIVETHSSPETAARLVHDRAQLLARRVYGDAAAPESEDYAGVELLRFRGPEPGRQLIAASSGSVVLVANNDDAIKSCLDTISGRAPSLAENNTLKELRPKVDHSASVFAFVTERGVEELLKFGASVFAGRFTTDADRASSIVELFGHLSKQTAGGFLYGSEFTEDGLTERYLTVLRPQLGEALIEPLKPAATADFESLPLIPAGIEDLTILNVEAAGDLPERMLKQLSPRVDLVAAIALREFVINLRKRLGLDSTDSVGSAIGNEIALVKFSDHEPVAMLTRVKDKTALLPIVSRYLARSGAPRSAEQYNGIEVNGSPGDDSPGAAFVGEYLVLATRPQIRNIIDTRAGGGGIRTDEGLKSALAARPAGASVISYRPGANDAGEFMLTVSKLTRVTDGSRDVMNREPFRAALKRLPGSISFTEVLKDGVYTESRSAMGSFPLIASIFTGEDEK